jgi:outer membrane protein, multidrug efflux system
MLGDTTLERLVAVAVEANRDLRAAEARVQSARAARTDAALDFGPSITASLGYSRQRLASASLPGPVERLPAQDLWDGALHMSWELDVFGRTRHSVQGRNALLASAEEDVADLQVVLLAEMARTYFELRGAQDRLAVARRNAENQRRTLELTVSRLEGGRGNALDTERARAQLSSTLAAIPALEAAAAAHVHRLASLLGRPPGALMQELQEPLVVAALPAELPLGNVDDIVRRRPDVRSAASRAAAGRAFHGAARAAYLPRLSIGGVAGYTASQFDALGNAGTPRYAVGPVISWPFLDLGRVKAGADAARAGADEAAARYEQAVLDAHAELETARIAYDRARERLQHLDDAAAASQRATELAQLRFEEGGTDFLEVLDAERRLLEAQDRLAAGRVEAVNALLAVYRASGGGAEPR